MHVRLKVIYTVVVLVIVGECTGIYKLDNYDKHASKQILNDHSTSKVLGHSDQIFNKPYFDLCKWFAEESFVKLHVWKYEVCVRQRVEDWWGDLLLAYFKREHSKSQARFENIGTFQGNLNSVMETHVVSVLLYSGKNWILTERMLEQLEACCGKLVKRATEHLYLWSVIVLKCAEFDQ